MTEFLAQLFDTSDFPARWHCGRWTAIHGWTHILSDVAIWGAYMAIPVALAFFVRRRRDVPFTGIFWLFCAFIAACGTGHLIESMIFWWPVYRVSALVKVATALVSWGTVLALIPMIPMALSLPGLARIHAELKTEIEERKRAEELLRAKADELKQANDELERFVGVALDREKRIIELKHEVNALSTRLGTTERYEAIVDGGSEHEGPI